MLQPHSGLKASAAGRPAAISGREARYSKLLGAAAQEFNSRGISGASLARIARRSGLSRAAVYYYFEDRHDLAAQCYARTCEAMASDLAAANAAPGRSLNKVLDFLKRSLDPGRAPSAALSELECLNPAAQAQISGAHRGNVDTLRALLRCGIKDKSIRACDDEIAAQTLIGTLTWVPLSVEWVEGTEESYRARTVGALCELIENGQAADRRFAYMPAVPIESFFPPPSSPFDRKAVSAAKVERLLMSASQLFNRRGIDGTSLDDIADSIGATKGVVYHYLDDKTDLVVHCYRRAYGLYERFADAAVACGRNGLERAMTGLYLNTQAHASGLAPLIQMAGVGALPPAAKREMTRRSRALQQRYKGFGEQGLADGSFRVNDFDAMAQLGAGAFEWLPKWFRTDDPRAGGMLAQEIVALFVRGLKAD